MVDLTDREVEVEALMARLGYERYWSDLSRAKEKGEYALRTDTGRHLLREMVWKVAERIELWFKEAKKAQKEKAGWQGLSALSPLQEIGADVAALLTCKCLLDNLTVRRSFQAMLMGLGYRLEDELLYRQVRKEARQLFDEVLRKTVRSGYKHRRRVMLFRAAKAGLELKRLPPRLLGRMALVASECAFEASGMFERENRWNSMRRRIEVFVHVKPEVLEWCEQSEREHEMLHPFYMPTVEEPLDWEGLHGGGYHTDIVFRRPLVKFFRWRHEKLVAEADYTRTAMAVNVLQHVPWEVNELVYQAASTLWHTGVQTGKLPTRDPVPIPPKPADIETNETARREWRRAAAVTHEHNVSERGRRIGVTRTLFVARTYREKGPFYFPHFADARGRLYASPLFLEPQSTDLARGLLRFQKGLPLGDHGLFWLGIHGANSFGLDKVTLEERVAWCHQHQREIEDVARDPIDARPFWEQAEKPWAFLAFCEDWAEAMAEGSRFESHLPVHIDGRNNGLQIYSLLARDELGARLTCVLPGDAPYDCYQDVADEATKRLVAIAERPHLRPVAKWKNMKRLESLDLEQRLARMLLAAVGGRLPRDPAKRPTMATPYGLRRWSADSYVRTWLDTIERPEWQGTYQMAHFLTPVLWASMGERLRCARAIMDWLRKLASLTAKENKPLRWHSPSGFYVIQDSRVQKTQEITSTVRAKVTRHMRLRSDKAEVDSWAQQDGFPPNYVHSLDAACLHLILLKMQAVGIPAVTTVHDGFACHAAHAAMMGAIVRKVYAEVFEHDQLRLLLAELEENTGMELPEPPPYGNLDPTCILESRYAFC